MSFDLSSAGASSAPSAEPGSAEFYFDFRAYDDPGDGQRWSTWLDVEPLCRGPEPRPDWVVTSQAARRHRARHPQDRQGGRRLPARAGRARRPGQRVVMAAKRYRGDGAPHLPPQQPPTPRAAAPSSSRDARALAQEDHARPRGRRRPVGVGRVGAPSSRLWSAGVPVPYPVQIDGTEILMESSPSTARPRRGWRRPGRAGDLLASYFDQLRDAMAELARHGRRARRPLAVQHPGGRASGW